VPSSPTIHDAQNLVAQPMAVKIVDGLEVVEVEHEERADAAVGEARMTMGELLKEAAAIGQACQHIMACETMGFPFGVLALGDLALEVAQPSPGEDHEG
jgi:hypothetical protein